ncbi:MAG: ribosome maturation factor RimP [Acidobacteria bacterium]|nr:ribosome maturation factor RimP [Acidobacteriota bacterium]
MTATRPDIEARIRALAAQVAAAAGAELVDLEFRQQGRHWLLRAYIDREGGVGAEDCARVSRQLGVFLDAEDLIGHRYVLEVSSPGLDRPLRTARDFQRNIGRLVLLRTREPIQGERELRGRISACPGEAVCLDRAEGDSLVVPVERIAEGFVLVDWDRGRNQKGTDRG